jgi:hypothetical protein
MLALLQVVGEALLLAPVGIVVVAKGTIALVLERKVEGRSEVSVCGDARQGPLCH